MTTTLIASSAHLAGGSAPDLSEVEFGLMIASHAFDRWTVRCMAAAGLPDLTPTDVMVFHHVFHRQRPKKLADICFTLNVGHAHRQLRAEKARPPRRGQGRARQQGSVL